MNIKKMSEFQFVWVDSPEPYIAPSMITKTYMSTLTAKTVLYADNPDQRINSTYVFLIKSALKYEKIAALANFINKMLLTEYQPKIIFLFDEISEMSNPRSTNGFFQDMLYWECSFSHWDEWKTGKYSERYHEIVRTLTAKVAERLNLNAGLIEELAVIQLLVETFGQINIFSTSDISPSLYYLRDFSNHLINNNQNRYWRPFQCFQVAFSKTVRYPARGGCMPYIFECNEGYKLIITSNKIYLEIPKESLNQPWAVYLNSIIDVLFDDEIPAITKEIIVKTIKKHYQIVSQSNERPLYNTLSPQHLHLFTELRVQASPNISNIKDRCSSTYVFAFSIVDALLGPRGYHSVECIKATVNFINQLAESDPQAKVIILIADELQALNAQAEFDSPLDILRSKFHEKGAKWVESCKIYFDKIRCRYQISHWTEWISGERQERFQTIFNTLKFKKSLHPEFDTATQQTYHPHLEKYRVKFSKNTSNKNDANAASLADFEILELNRVSPFFEAYPIEETAVIQLVVENFGPMNLFYPKELNPTLYFLKDNWSLLTDSKPNPNWRPFKDFQVPCMKRTTTEGIPVAACGQFKGEGFSLTYGKRAMQLEMPIAQSSNNKSSWCAPYNDLITDIYKSFSNNRDETKEDDWFARPLTEQNCKHLSLFWHLGGVLRKIYDKNVSAEDKTNIVRTIENSYSN